MRVTTMLLMLILAQISWGVPARGQVAPASAEAPLMFMPTALQELKELRINTGRKAVLKDGTMNAVYVKKVPSKRNTYLNFHLNVVSEAKPLVLHSRDIYLESVQVQGAKGKTPATVSYTPMDWFMDTGSEVRGDSLTVNDKAILEFTIEVPQGNIDDLTLFVQSHRIGTVREIRERIAAGKGE